MANFTHNVITVSGLRLMSDCLALGAGIEFTHFGIGDGAIPAIPAAQTELVHHLFDVAVSRTMASAQDEGTAIVEGTYTNTTECGDFFEREIGTYARPAGTEIEPVLFSYQHAGDKADYIPTVGAGSVIRQSIVVSLAVGSADVLFTADPMGQVSRAELDQAKIDIENAKTELDRVSDGFVARAGDIMTGELSAPAFNGDLHGSADKWDGWTHYSSLESISKSLSSKSSLDEVCSAMVSNSIFIIVIAEQCSFAPAQGVLEIRKARGTTGDSATAQMSAGAGLVFTAYKTANGNFSPWYSAIGDQPGQGSFTFAWHAPIGYLMAHGQTVSRAQYPALFAAIGLTYTSVDDGVTFNLPDTRGMFLRGFDAGRGIDVGRNFATEQKGGVPNITGRFYADDSTAQRLNGAFYASKPAGTDIDIDSRNYNGYGGYYVNISAARCSDVYSSAVTEVRPCNLAVNYIIKY